MATNKNPIFLNSVSSKCAEIDNAQGTTPEVIFTAGSDGGAIMNLTATSTDTVDATVVLTIDDGTQVNVIGEVSVPFGSGTNDVAVTVNLLDSTALPGVLQNDGSLVVGASATLSVAVKSTVSATKVVSITCVGGSYSA